MVKPTPHTAPSTGIALNVSISKVRGSNTATLSWTGATSGVDVFRNGSFLKSVTGSSTTDNLGRGGGS